MIEDLEAELANVARLTHPAQLREEVKKITDAFDGDGGNADDERQYARNRLHSSQDAGGASRLTAPSTPSPARSS